MPNQNQRTVAGEISLSGVGLHTGLQSTLTFKPAPPGTWYVFVRKDLPGEPRINAVVDNALPDLVRGTTLEQNGAQVSTVEHVLASLYGLGIDNCIIELDAPEPPVLDGSAKPFADAIIQVGIAEQNEQRQLFEPTEVIQFSDPSRKTDIHVIPFSSFRVTIMVDYANPALGTQYTTLVSNEEEFLPEFAPARTFCFLSEIVELRKKGLIKGGRLDNAIVIADIELTDDIVKFLKSNFNIPPTEKIFIGSNGILNNTALRFYNEPVRHKVIDLLGDIALLGAFMKGHIIGARSGHPANVALVRLLKKQFEKQLIAGKFGAKDKSLDINAIQKMLPHRYPFLMVDKLLDFEAGKYAVAIKNVSINEPYFTGHFPGHPVMPGVLQIEALAQTGAFLLLHSAPDPEKTVTYFVGVDKVRFKKPVLPGDQLVLRVEMIFFRRGICKFSGVASVNGEIVCEGEFMATLVPK